MEKYKENYRNLSFKVSARLKDKARVGTMVHKIRTIVNKIL